MKLIIRQHNQRVWSEEWAGDRELTAEAVATAERAATALLAAGKLKIGYYDLLLNDRGQTLDSEILIA